MSNPRCFVVSQSNQWFRGFCRDSGVNPKSKQIICVTYDTVTRLLEFFDPDVDYVVFLAHWNDFLSDESADNLVGSINWKFSKARDPDRRRFRPLLRSS